MVSLKPRAIRERLAARAALNSVVPLALLALLLALAVWWLVAASVRPLARVARDVGQRDAEALSPVPLAGLPDEAQPLVAALNALLQRLSAWRSPALASVQFIPLSRLTASEAAPPSIFRLVMTFAPSTL